MQERTQAQVRAYSIQGSTSAVQWDPFDTESWVLRPSSHAQSRNDFLKQYKWHGLKLRSPVYDTRDYDRWTWEADAGIASLRTALKVHVNSTCPFNVFVRPRGRGLGLIEIKKLVTLLWLLERGLFLPLWPRQDNDPAGRPPLVTTHSAAAALSIKEIQHEQDPGLSAAEMYQNVPRLHDDWTWEKLQRIWTCLTCTELSRAICGVDGRPLAFSLHQVPAMKGNGNFKSPDYVVFFQYGIWHPHPDIDAFDHWFSLLKQCCGLMGEEAGQFRDLLQRIDNRIMSFKTSNARAHWHRMLLLEELGADSLQFDGWDKIIHEYHAGGKLSPEHIDKNPTLKPVP